MGCFTSKISLIEIHNPGYHEECDSFQFIWTKTDGRIVFKLEDIDYTYLSSVLQDKLRCKLKQSVSKTWGFIMNKDLALKVTRNEWTNTM